MEKYQLFLNDGTETWRKNSEYRSMLDAKRAAMELIKKQEWKAVDSQEVKGSQIKDIFLSDKKEERLSKYKIMIHESRI